MIGEAIFTTLVGSAEGAVATSYACGVFDTFAMSAGAFGIQKSFSKDTPEKNADDARKLCRYAHWLKHKAAQMFSLSRKLDRNAKDLDRETKTLLKSVESTTDVFSANIQQLEKDFLPRLILTVALAVGMVIIFVCYGIIKGQYLRSKLSDLRNLESDAQAQEASLSAPDSTGAPGLPV